MFFDEWGLQGDPPPLFGGPCRDREGIVVLEPTSRSCIVGGGGAWEMQGSQSFCNLMCHCGNLCSSTGIDSCGSGGVLAQEID